MQPSIMPPCVWRGSEEDPSSFDCLHAHISKRVCPEECVKCQLRHDPIEPLPGFAPPELPEKIGVIQKIANGAVGLSKAALGIDRADEETIKERWNICQSCEFYKNWRCTQCGCIASAKVTINSERCPIGKWEASGREHGEESQNGPLD